VDVVGKLSELILNQLVSTMISNNSEAHNTGNLIRSRKVESNVLSYNAVDEKGNHYASNAYSLGPKTRWTNKDTKPQWVEKEVYSTKFKTDAEEVIAKWFNQK
jgi:hypothetical protein